jgi:hypothetical protein
MSYRFNGFYGLPPNMGGVFGLGEYTATEATTYHYNWWNIGGALDLYICLGMSSVPVNGGMFFDEGYDDLAGYANFVLAVSWGAEINGTPGCAIIRMFISPFFKPKLTFISARGGTFTYPTGTEAFGC